MIMTSVIKERNFGQVLRLLYRVLQRIPVAVARGVITGYRVNVVDYNHSRKLEFNATDEPFLRLRELLSDDDYVNLAVEARTSVGYNDSLHLHVIHIQQLTRGLFSAFHVNFITVLLMLYLYLCIGTSDDVNKQIFMPV